MALIIRALVLTCVFSFFMSSYIVINPGKIAVHAATVEATSNNEAINAAVSAFQEIGSLRKEEPVNADAEDNKVLVSIFII